MSAMGCRSSPVFLSLINQISRIRGVIRNHRTMNAEVSQGTLRYAQREGIGKIDRHHGIVPGYIQRAQLRSRELDAKAYILKEIQKRYPRLLADQKACFGLAMYLSDEAFTEYRKYADKHSIEEAYLWQLGKRLKKSVVQ